MKKRVLLYGLGGLAAIIALTGIAGMMMNPVIHTTAAIDIARPPATVFALLRDMESVNKWANVDGADFKVVKISDTPKRYKSSVAGMESTCEEVEAVEPNFLHTRVAGQTVDVSGEWRTSIEPTASGSHVTNKIAMRFGNPFFRVMGHLMDSHAEEMKTMVALKKYLEAQP